jgi:hypothetical protein
MEQMPSGEDIFFESTKYVTQNIHYEKLCPWKLHYLVIRTLKQLICNYIATIPWKYMELKNKMSCQKFME